MRITVLFVAIALILAAVLLVARLTADVWGAWFGGDLLVVMFAIYGFFILAALTGLSLGVAALNTAYLIGQHREPPVPLIHKVIGFFAGVGSLFILGGLMVIMNR